MNDTMFVPRVIRIDDRPYQIRGRLGLGSFSRVFEAVGRTGQILALKLPLPEVPDAVRYLHRDRDARLLLRRHHGPLALHGIDDLVDHGTVREPDEYLGLPALVLPKHAATVADIFAQADPFPEIRHFLRTPAGFLRLCRGSLSALAAIEAVNMRHSDIKLSNMAVIPHRDGGRLYDIDFRLLDFGGAKWAENMDASMGVGTPSYMPPEARWPGFGKWEGGENREQQPLTDDMFGLGNALYGILMGSLPHRQRNGLPPPPESGDVLEPDEVRQLKAVCAAIGKRLRPVGSAPVGGDDLLCDLIRRCLSVDRRRRPTAVDGLARLRNYADDHHDAETILCAGFRVEGARGTAGAVGPCEPAVDGARRPAVGVAAEKPRRRLFPLLGLLAVGWAGYATARDQWKVPVAIPAEALRYSTGLPGAVLRPLCPAADGVPALPAGAVLTLQAEFGPGFPLGDTLHPLAVDMAEPGLTLAHQPTPSGGRCPEDTAAKTAASGRQRWCPSLRLGPAARRHIVAVAVARSEPLRQQRLVERLNATEGRTDAVDRILSEEAHGSARILLRTLAPSAACPL
ncbi:hypothetical protein VY88_18535 [Azospirillum thiophilum]|uniref:Protein kinase domain-containing protein n=2 Tax=Azospirillum thiophilum TaxID=528244 RepID=A0AAC8W2X3_9PROT|nr:hypothetical protein AL072_24385 [Azospirillum thiophilum]KJR63529.1 hypothetical protein VY88_18535 [Azospirillum thiophilum]